MMTISHARIMAVSILISASIVWASGDANGGDQHESEGIGATIMGHIQDHDLVHIPPFQIVGETVNLSITMHTMFLWVPALLCIMILWVVASRIKAGKGGRLVGVFEILIGFVRKEIVLPNVGPRYARSLDPYFLTVFFFILFSNIIGLIPGTATATSNVSVTAGLAGMAFIVMQGVAIKDAGIGKYLAHLTGGVHWALWPIMIPVEFLGLFTKPFALCIRLFANMTAGHIVILSLLGLIFVFGADSAAAGYGIAPVSIAFSLFVYLLEILVSLIQAYIFTMLTAVFAGMGVHDTSAEGDH